MNVTPLPESFNWLLNEDLTVTGVVVGRTETCVSVKATWDLSLTAAIRSLPAGEVLICGKAYDLGDNYPVYLGLLDAAVEAGVGAELPSENW